MSGENMKNARNGVDEWAIGGDLIIDNGGTLTLAAGSTVSGAITIAGVTAISTEINRLAGVVAGTSAASKAVVLDAQSKVSALDITALKLNGGSVTATAAEVNLSDDLPASFTFTPAAGASTVCEITIQAKDAAGVAMARAVLFMLYLSDANTGIGLTGTAASGAVDAKTASGTNFGVLTAKKALLCQTKVDGTFILSITDTSKTGYYVCAVPMRGGVPSVSAQLITANYGA